MTIQSQQAAARVKILAAAIAAPGTCIVCGSAGGDHESERKFLDIDMDIEFYGAVYFCTYCLAEVVSVMGYVSEETVADIKAENEALKAERLAAYTKEKLVDGFLSTIFSAGSVYISGRDLLSGSVSDDEDIEELLERHGETTGLNSAAGQLTSIERSDDVSSATGRKLSAGLEL